MPPQKAVSSGFHPAKVEHPRFLPAPSAAYKAGNCSISARPRLQPDAASFDQDQLPEST